MLQHTHQNQKYLWSHLLKAVPVLLLLLLLILTAFIRFSTHAAGITCPAGSSGYQVVFGDTLGSIAARYQTTWQAVATLNNLSNPNLIFPGETMCIPGQQTISSAPLTGPGSSGNYYPQGQCTYWANERYFQIHHVFVPWTTNADAWQWIARAHDFNWIVSSTPQVGDIIDLQPNVQGASSLGHVGVVEQILPNGHVLASNLNWGANPGQIAYVEFAPGPGVTFIRQ